MSNKRNRLLFYTLSSPPSLFTLPVPIAPAQHWNLLLMALRREKPKIFCRPSGNLHNSVDFPTRFMQISGRSLAFSFEKPLIANSWAGKWKGKLCGAHVNAHNGTSELESSDRALLNGRDWS